MSVNLRKSYSKLNEKLAAAFDGLGVRRMATVPYVSGGDDAEHINAVQQVIQQSGGTLANYMPTSFHKGEGKGHGSADGETALHPTDKLRSTIVPKDSKVAKEAIEAAQEHINNFKELLGKDDPTVLTAQNQLNLVRRSDAAGMNLFDLGVMLQTLPFKMTQKVAKLHGAANANAPSDGSESGTGAEQPEGGESQPEAQGEAQAAPQGQEAAQAPAGGQAQPESQGGTPQQAAQPQQA